MLATLLSLLLLATSLLSVKPKYLGEEKPGNGVWRFTGEVDATGAPGCEKCGGEATECAASKGEHADYCTVAYFSEAEREALRVHYDRAQKKWLRADGQVLDTRVLVQRASEAGAYRAEKLHGKLERWGANPALWVMDESGALYVSPQARSGRFHHSSILAGASVLCAGTIDVKDGVILHLDNASGHYQPPAESLEAALALLKEQQGVQAPIPHELCCAKETKKRAP